MCNSVKSGHVIYTTSLLFSVEKKCDQTTNMFISNFVNPSFSTIDSGTGECKLTVNPMNSNICQYRLDFDTFEILGPNRHSKCVDDFFGVTGGSPVPKMCGDLTGQHGEL